MEVNLPRKWVSDGLSFYYLLSSFNRKTYSRSFIKTGIINNSFLDDSILPLLPSPYLTDSQMSLGKEHVLLSLQKKKFQSNNKRSTITLFWINDN